MDELLAQIESLTEARSQELPIAIENLEESTFNLAILNFTTNLALSHSTENNRDKKNVRLMKALTAFLNIHLKAGYSVD